MDSCLLTEKAANLQPTTANLNDHRFSWRISMMCIAFMLVMIFGSLTNENRRQVGEDERLDESYQYFDHENENRKRDRDRCETPTGTLAQRAKDEDEGDQTDNDNVTRQHICEKTNYKGKRLCKNAKYLHRYHYKLNTERNRRIKYMTPKMLVSTKHDDQEGNHPKNSSKSNVAGNVC